MSPPSAWQPEQLRQAIDAAGVALWSWNVDEDCLTMDQRGFELWRTEPGPTITFARLSENIHPADRDRVGAAFTATRAITGAYEIDFRIMAGADVRWISARGQGKDAEIADRTMFGIFLDVTGRKLAEEGHELLAGEMSHRVKNLLAIASGLAQITSRSAKTTADMAQDLTRRLTALGRAHDLVRPLPDADGKAALLADLLAVLLAPYDDMGAFSGRIRIAVPRLGVGEATATTLGLVLHELATNSLKFGALSVSAGTLDVSCAAQGEDIVLVWTEQGGPVIEAPMTIGGFGSKLVARTMERQLGGTIAYDWTRSGAIVTLRMRNDRLAA